MNQKMEVTIRGSCPKCGSDLILNDNNQVVCGCQVWHWVLRSSDQVSMAER